MSRYPKRFRLDQDIYRNEAEINIIKSKLKDFLAKMNKIEAYLINAEDLIYDEFCEFKRLVHLDREETISKIKAKNGFNINQEDFPENLSVNITKIHDQSDKLLEVLEMHEKEARAFNAKINKNSLENGLKRIKTISESFLSLSETIFQEWKLTEIELTAVVKNLTYAYKKLGCFLEKMKKSLFGKTISILDIKNVYSSFENEPKMSLIVSAKGHEKIRSSNQLDLIDLRIFSHIPINKSSYNQLYY